MKCGSPIILFDGESKSENFSALSDLGCFLTCESFNDVFDALNSRFFEAPLGASISEKCRMNSKIDAVLTICETIINFNNIDNQ